MSTNLNQSKTIGREWGLDSLVWDNPAMSQLTKLRRPLSINSGAGPVVGPGDVPVLAEGQHRLDGERHAGLALSNGLVLGVMRNVWRAVEDGVDAVADIRPNDAAVIGLCVLLDDVAKLAEEGAGLDELDGLVETLARRLNQTDDVGVCERLVADVVRLIQVAMVAFMV